MIPTRHTFRWHAHELRYLDAPYNDTLQNERAVELPIVQRWLIDQPAGPVLEVGNVLAHYGCTIDRTVIDRWEHAPHVIDVDVLAWSGRYQTIVSVSTIEHVRWDEHPQQRNEREPDGPMRAFRHLRALLKPGGRMLVTVPMGHHPGLDLAILEDELRVDRETTYVRDPETGNWLPHGRPRWSEYGVHDAWASAVWIGETSREMLA